VYHTNNNAIHMTMMVNDNVFISSIMSVTKYYYSWEVCNIIYLL